MKYTIFPFILLCTLFTLIPTGCENTELQKSLPNDQVKIEPRSDCELCPDDEDCCCFVELDGLDASASLRFCGTSNGMDACSGGAVCGFSTFSGGGQTINLNSTTNPGQLFCMGKGNPFWIYNYSTMDDAYIVITCQMDHTAPQVIHIHLMPGERFYYETNTDCEINPC